MQQLYGERSRANTSICLSIPWHVFSKQSRSPGPLRERTPTGHLIHDIRVRCVRRAAERLWTQMCGTVPNPSRTVRTETHHLRLTLRSVKVSREINRKTWAVFVLTCDRVVCEWPFIITDIHASVQDHLLNNSSLHHFGFLNHGWMPFEWLQGL